MSVRRALKLGGVTAGAVLVAAAALDRVYRRFLRERIANRGATREQAARTP